jgi:hypothetical protein
MEGKENSIQTRTPYKVHVSFDKCKLNPHLKRGEKLYNFISINNRYWEIKG